MLEVLHFDQPQIIDATDQTSDPWVRARQRIKIERRRLQPRERLNCVLRLGVIAGFDDPGREAVNGIDEQLELFKKAVVCVLHGAPMRRSSFARRLAIKAIRFGGKRFHALSCCLRSVGEFDGG